MEDQSGPCGAQEMCYNQKVVECWNGRERWYDPASPIVVERHIGHIERGREEHSIDSPAYGMTSLVPD